MSQEIFSQLLNQYISGELSPQEKARLNEMMNDPSYEDALEALVRETMLSDAYGDIDNPALKARIDAWLDLHIAGDVDGALNRQAPAIKLWTRIAVAAILVLLVTGAYLLFLSRSPKQTSSIQQPNVTDDRTPGRNTAMLTIADGRQIPLDSAANGPLATQDNVNLVKTADGQIAYNPQSAGGPAQQPANVFGPGQSGTTNPQLVYNTLTVPRGGKVVTLTLADGSKVWLNSESSLKYPVAFTGAERKVEITGEAYFEVAHDKNKKFQVTAGNITTEVLGTHFNVNAYGDENDTRVSLLEGLVRVSSLHPVTSPNQAKGAGSGSVLLKPGQQAQTGNDQKAQPGTGQQPQAGASQQVGARTVLKINTAVDMESVMAWKNGLFQMKGTDLGSLMRQISRWYDVQVSFEGPLPKKSFGGSINRDLNLSDVLKALEQYGIRTRMENGVLIIQKE
jgi:transmembrane sensor